MSVTTAELDTTSREPQPAWRRPLRTILFVVALLLVYAFAVEATEIRLERLVDESRQENVLRVLRLLADPDFTDVNEAGEVVLSETTIITVERIIETIFMALVASTAGTVLAIPLSFLAARNLMAPVTAPLAAIMAGVIAIPVGAAAGAAAGRLLAEGAAAVASEPALGLAALLAAGLALRLTLRWSGLADEDGESWRGRGLAAGRIALAGLLFFFGLALLGQLGTHAGAWLEANLGPFGFLGYFVQVLADLIGLLLPALLGLLGGLIGLLLGSRYGQEAVLRLKLGAARLLSAALTALGAAALAFGVGSALTWLYRFDEPENWTSYPALASAVVGAAVGLALRPKRPVRIGLAIYTVMRAILNVLRSIEPLIMAIVFVVWVSIGPFAGILALLLHSIAALGKLFSEQVEGIDEGPVEAVTATGANRVQTTAYAVIPQIVAPFTAFALYRWDINVRLSTIIGFVGGGGIGFVLSQNISRLRYRQASVMMLAIALVVSLLDYASSKLRRRII
ncbi:MAG: ABC transporter permease subunit [Candidatus Promineifilaceae bacterium]